LNGTAHRLADEEGISIIQLITLALAEKISALKAEEIFRKRAALPQPSADRESAHPPSKRRKGTRLLRSRVPFLRFEGRQAPSAAARRWIIAGA
jgi:hypothetical protein